ncbi:hypothetical protein [Streptomyces sp. NPDC048603]|uniref:hypothetical protein n=1 Tax=Streptomyces sp. NPDC048603 TaxID=3365577 RepID=UPI00371C5B60
MQLIVSAVAAVTAAVTSIAFMQYVMAANPTQRIPLILLRPANVPLRVEVVCYPAWGASGALLGSTLPLWAATALGCTAAWIPWDVLRRRHNRRVTNHVPIT